MLKLCRSHLRLFVSIGISLSLVTTLIVDPVRAENLTAEVKPTIPSLPPATEVLPHNGDATNSDVLACTALAEAVAILAWHLPAALRLLGKGATAANTKLISIMGIDKNLATGIEMVLAALGVKVMPKKWMEMTIEEFLKHVIQPMWESCMDIVDDFGSLPSSLGTLLVDPVFYTPAPNDGPGVRTGKVCAESNDGMFGGGYDGCIKCCEAKLTQSNGLGSSLPACIAVCKAQFQ